MVGITPQEILNKSRSASQELKFGSSYSRCMRTFQLLTFCVESCGSVFRPTTFSPVPGRTRRLAIATGLIAILGLGLSATLNAADEQESHDNHRGCTLATLQGRYLFAESGVLLPPAFGVAVPTQAADAGMHLFNGDGTGTDTVTLRVGGQVVLENVVNPTFYTVNADCTGTVTVVNGPSLDIFIAPDGSEFAEIATAPSGNYPAGIARRVSHK
jgi:hypothetical protein